MSNDYTRLFVPYKGVDREAAAGFLRLQNYINNVGKSAGVTSGLTISLSTSGGQTPLPAETTQWDYFNIVTKSTVAGIMTVQDPGIYLCTSNVLFTSLSTTCNVNTIATSSVGGFLPIPLVASGEATGFVGDSINLNAVTTCQVTTVPSTLKLSAFVSPGSSSAQANLVNWSITRLFPIPSNRA